MQYVLFWYSSYSSSRAELQLVRREREAREMKKKSACNRLNASASASASVSVVSEAVRADGRPD